MSFQFFYLQQLWDFVLHLKLTCICTVISFIGVYALLAAHLANVLLNYNNMEFGLVRLLGVFLIGKRLSQSKYFLFAIYSQIFKNFYNFSAQVVILFLKINLQPVWMLDSQSTTAMPPFH